MKKSLLTLIVFCSLGVFSIFAQSGTEGISYQAVVRDAAGKVLANASVSIKVALVSENKDIEAYYTETHQVNTDFAGQVNLVIGGGQDKKGVITQVPWGKEQIWLDVQVLGDKASAFKINSRTQLLSVPYALHAATTSKLTEEAPTEKNQSIYWHTGGNTKTLPATHFVGTRDNKNLVLKTNNDSIVVFKTIGQTHVTGRVTGDDRSSANYPLTISGSTQGIYIKVKGSRDGSNNFVTFADDVAVWGRIEGQTFEELEDTWQYDLQVTSFALEGTALGLLIIGEAVESFGQAASIFGIGAAVAGYAQVATLIIEAASILAESITWAVNIRKDIGVTYESGAGDYAEWLKRAPGERDIHHGEIIGIKAGLVSLNTAEADHIMVVSKRPAVLGNAPQMKDRPNFEKIAFMGQVPVKVSGPVALGDFIVASGNHDGFGVAIHPKDMKSGDYARSVGVAWQAAPDLPINFVNVAVGINTNDLSTKVDHLNKEIDNITAYLEGKAPLLDDEQLQTASAAKTVNPHTNFQKLLSDEEFDQILDQHKEVFLKIFADAKVEMQKKGYDLEALPQVAAFLDNPIPSLKAMRRNPAHQTQWALVDQNLKLAKSRR
jgi:hypothetical protein